MDLSEHISGLTVAGFYYWFTDNELGAITCWKAGVAILPMLAVPNPKGMEWIQ
jgi:hypothetical protein